MLRYIRMYSYHALECFQELIWEIRDHFHQRHLERICQRQGHIPDGPFTKAAAYVGNNPNNKIAYTFCKTCGFILVENP
jgi:hypothetical protein